MSKKAITLRSLKLSYGKLSPDVSPPDSAAWVFRLYQSLLYWLCTTSPCVWRVNLTVRAGHLWAKGQRPNLIWTHQVVLFFGHGLWPPSHSTFSQMPDPVSQGTGGPFLKEFTEIHYHYWKGHSKVRVYGQGSLKPSLTVHGRLTYDTKVHLSDKSILVVPRVSLGHSYFTVAGNSSCAHSQWERLVGTRCMTKHLRMSWKQFSKRRFSDL